MICGIASDRPAPTGRTAARAARNNRRTLPSGDAAAPRITQAGVDCTATTRQCTCSLARVTHTEERTTPPGQRSSPALLSRLVHPPTYPCATQTEAAMVPRPYGPAAMWVASFSRHPRYVAPQHTPVTKPTENGSSCGAAHPSVHLFPRRLTDRRLQFRRFRKHGRFDSCRRWSLFPTCTRRTRRGTRRR